VLDLNPNPSNFEGFGTPASFNGAWTKHRCRAEWSATHPPKRITAVARLAHPGKSCYANLELSSEQLSPEGYQTQEARAEKQEGRRLGCRDRPGAGIGVVFAVRRVRDAIDLHVR
jgi:hypothetical protein